MKRFNEDTHKEETFPDVDNFLAEIKEVCRRHNFWIGHEDHHGAFEIHAGFDEEEATWIDYAQYYPPEVK